MDNCEITVCIHCMTYNHEKYLSDALEGFVMQKTTFPFVAVVIDDCSTDGTADVLREYEKKYPDIIKAVYLQENYYSQHKTKQPFLEPWDSKAKYIALCEGDDYWIEPLKLQKQVDFLESHPEYSSCFTNCIVKFPNKELIGNYINWDTYNTRQMILHNALGVKKREDNIVSAGHTSTILYRNPFNPIPQWVKKCFIGDEPLFVALCIYGKAKFINECTSIYRAGVGVSSRNFTHEKDWLNRIAMYRLMNKGLSFRYNFTIRSIIAHFYFKLAKIEKSRNNHLKMGKYLLAAICNNPIIIFYRWMY